MTPSALLHVHGRDPHASLDEHSSFAIVKLYSLDTDSFKVIAVDFFIDPASRTALAHDLLKVAAALLNPPPLDVKQNA
jgi:hypothetical protein